MQNQAITFMPFFNQSDAKENCLTIHVHSEQELPAKYVSPNETTTVHLSCRDVKTYKIEFDSYIIFSQKVQNRLDYLGIASKLISSAYFFTRKSLHVPVRKVTLALSTSKSQEIIALAQACIKTKQLANGRGDIQGSSRHFINKAKQLSLQLPVKLTVIEGEQLLESGLRMHHAVGRASQIKPALINLAYNGNKNSLQWLAFVGKGVLFDTGGLNLKSTDDLSTMFMDKHAACSCLVAFEAFVRQNIKTNLTVSLGLAENCIGSQSYRPSDILLSRKGLTVKVADTDAEGRLILADVMNWTQQTYRVARMVEMSTLTYSCMKGLGRFHAGVYSNDEQFQRLIISLGKQVAEEGWPMPLTQDHHDMLECSEADCLSDVDDCPGGSIGAAFLEKFVERGVKWVHLDVLGVCIEDKQATGWGAKLLIQLAKRLSQS